MGLEPINDSKLATAVLQAYATGRERITWEECRRLGFNESQSHALLDALEPRPNTDWSGPYAIIYSLKSGLVTPEDREMLRRAGFSRSFIRSLAGADGAEPLRRRARWLADQVVNLKRRGPGRTIERDNYLRELKVIGPYAKDVVSVLLRIARAKEDPIIHDDAINALAALGVVTPEVVLAILAVGRSGNHFLCHDALKRLANHSGKPIPLYLNKAIQEQSDAVERQMDAFFRSAK